MRILITGGAGFIGRHLAAALLSDGSEVRILDNLVEQVHGDRDPRPILPADAELIVGDIRNPTIVARALNGVDKVVHLAAEVGVGQSMYAVDRYVATNDLGTAVLFQHLIREPVQRVVVASSMSVYGEGLYKTADGKLVEDATRDSHAVTKRGWEPTDQSGRPLIPLPTPEWKRPSLASVYALTKFVQERLTLALTDAYGMEGVALRLFNVYGPGQSLSNPYTGVLAIFASRILNGNPPAVFEDGRQRRDFVHVSDVANAFAKALTAPEAVGEVFNIGSGQDRSVAEVAHLLAAAMGHPKLDPEFLGKGRSGDIRHCFADIGKAAAALDFRPQQDFSAGLAELAEWVAKQQAVDKVAEARRELELRGLVA